MVNGVRGNGRLPAAFPRPTLQSHVFVWPCHLPSLYKQHQWWHWVSLQCHSVRICTIPSASAPQPHAGVSSLPSDSGNMELTKCRSIDVQLIYSTPTTSLCLLSLAGRSQGALGVKAASQRSRSGSATCWNPSAPDVPSQPLAATTQLGQIKGLCMCAPRALSQESQRSTLARVHARNVRACAECVRAQNARPAQDRERWGSVQVCRHGCPSFSMRCMYVALLELCGSQSMVPCHTHRLAADIRLSFLIMLLQSGQLQMSGNDCLCVCSPIRPVYT